MAGDAQLQAMRLDLVNLYSFSKVYAAQINIL